MIYILLEIMLSIYLQATALQTDILLLVKGTMLHFEKLIAIFEMVLMNSTFIPVFHSAGKLERFLFAEFGINKAYKLISAFCIHKTQYDDNFNVLQQCNSSKVSLSI